MTLVWLCHWIYVPQPHQSFPANATIVCGSRCESESVSGDADEGFQVFENFPYSEDSLHQQ